MRAAKLAGAARRRHDIAGAPDAERPLSPWVISTVSQRPEAIAAAAWWTWIMNEHPPTAVPSIESLFLFVLSS